jgi:hypothetical protein
MNAGFLGRPAALDVAGFFTFLLILAVAIQASRTTHRATLQILTQDDGNDS